MSDSEPEIDSSSHTKALKRLRTKDPEFYDFLKENDPKLLDYQDSDDDEQDQEEENGASINQEADEIENSVSMTAINELKQEIQERPTVQTCKQLISIFKSSVSKVCGTESQRGIDGDLFNEVMKLCLVELVPALQKVLKLRVNQESQLSDPGMSKTWKKLTTTIKTYLIELLKTLPMISEPSSIKLLLKHVVSLVPFYIQFPKLSKHLVKKMTQLWSTSEESISILALMAIVRTYSQLCSDLHRPHILKQMYFAYVRNTKFTSPRSWPMINFMKRSLVQVYALNPEIAYEHAFVYLRQLSIHLRNAITTKKKEAYQTVYNWQFIHCIIFWAHLICTLYQNEAVKTLIYPLVQTIIGTINLIPTVKYVPLRFHLVRILIEIASETKVFVSVPPFLLDVLSLTDYNKKATFSKKPMNFLCCLKASEAQLHESAFKDGIIAEVCCLLTDYFKVYSHSIGFPELVLPAVMQIKAFLKNNRVSKYGHQLKGLLDKLQANSKFITGERNNITCKITDQDKIENWELRMEQQGTPLSKLQNQERNDVIENREMELNEPPKKKKRMGKMHRRQR